MARAKQSCIYCDGKGRVVRFGEKYPCPYCSPPPGAIVCMYSDNLTKITHYDKDGKVLRVDEIRHKKRRTRDEVVDDHVRLQSEEEKQEPQKETKRRSNKGVARKRRG